MKSYVLTIAVFLISMSLNAQYAQIAGMALDAATGGEAVHDAQNEKLLRDLKDQNEKMVELLENMKDMQEEEIEAKKAPNKTLFQGIMNYIETKKSNIVTLTKDIISFVTQMETLSDKDLEELIDEVSTMLDTVISMYKQITVILNLSDEVVSAGERSGVMDNVAGQLEKTEAQLKNTMFQLETAEKEAKQNKLLYGK